ncbi:MAG: two-component SAPR family response regulator [Bacteriovoracaceae bacterium]
MKILNNKKPNIGVVDDDFAVINYIINELDERFNPYLFTWTDYGGDNYSTFREYIENKNLDMFIIDVNLPDVSGFEVGENIRKVLGSRVPIIYISSDLENMKFMERKAVNIFLKKPLKANELISAIDYLSEFIEERSRIRVAI